MISFSKKILTTTFVLSTAIVLSACSSKPSPWAQDSASSAPWELRNEATAQEEPLMNEAESDYPAETAAVEGEPAEIGSTVVAQVEPEPEIQTTEMMTESPSVDAVAASTEVSNEVVAEQAEDTGMLEMKDSTVVQIPSGGISEQPAGMYAVQVVASSSLEKLHDFIEQYQFSDRWIVETNVDGKVWFVLMSGVYSTKAEADEALASLRELGTQPWIRTVESVRMVMD